MDDLLHEIRQREAVRRARAGHHPDQADVGGPDRLPAAGRRPGPLSPLGHRRHRADGDPARSPAGRLRRAGGDQPAARGARPARGLAGGHPRRRPGGLPPLRSLPGADHRPGGAQRATAAPCSTPTGSPARCSARSTRWTGAAPSSSATTRSTASRRGPSSSPWRRCGSPPTWPTRAPSGPSRGWPCRSAWTCTTRPSAPR